MYRKYYIKIEILPDARVRIYAPNFIGKEKIIKKYKKWIEDKVNFVKSILEEVKGKENMFLYKGGFLPVEFLNKNLITKDKVYIKDFESFKKYLREIALRKIKEKVIIWSNIMNIKNFNKISIRSSKKVWGSCSPKNNLNFSIRILALPDNLINYLVIHELSHLVYKKHTKVFWNFVKRYYPKYKEAKKELTKYQIMIENNSIWKKILK